MASDSLDIQPVRVAPVAAASYEPPRDVAQTYPGGITTVIVDSIAGDTVSGRIPHFIPVNVADSLRNEALADSMARTQMATLPSGIREGIAPMGLSPSYVNSTPLAALLMGTLVLAALNAGSLRRALKAYRAELWSVRRRPNVFDDEQSAPAPIAVVLALVFIVFGGVVLYNLHGVPSPPTFFGVTASMAILGAYYLFQRCAYWLVGYTFGTADGRRRWIGGFAATHAFAGIALILPALLMVFQPAWHGVLLTISLTIYFAARILFIAKGFRIFYQKIWSLLYFILYLCTLEILPMLIIYRLTALLAGGL